MTRYALLALAFSLSALPAAANAASFGDDELAGGPTRDRRDVRISDADHLQDAHAADTQDMPAAEDIPRVRQADPLLDESPPAPSAHGVPERRLTWAGRDRS